MYLECGKHPYISWLIIVSTTTRKLILTITIIGGKITYPLSPYLDLTLENFAYMHPNLKNYYFFYRWGWGVINCPYRWDDTWTAHVKQKNLRVLPWGWPNHPRRPRGWFGHPKTKPSNFFVYRFALRGGRTTPMVHGSGRTTPMDHGSGSATPRSAGRATPKTKPSNFFTYRFALGCGQTTPMGHRGGSATPKAKLSNFFVFRFVLGDGQTTSMGHRGGSATPRPVKKYIVATCHILNGVTWRWRRFSLGLDGKMDGCTICIFFHNTCTIYDFKKKKKKH
jgi:hypothetical protein